MIFFSDIFPPDNYPNKSENLFIYTCNTSQKIIYHVWTADWKKTLLPSVFSLIQPSLWLVSVIHEISLTNSTEKREFWKCIDTCWVAECSLWWCDKLRLVYVHIMCIEKIVTLVRCKEMDKKWGQYWKVLLRIQIKVQYYSRYILPFWSNKVKEGKML